MDGPTLFRKMRETAETKELPVVFITAKASQRELDELRALGAAGTISKPFSPKDLPGAAPGDLGRPALDYSFTVFSAPKAPVPW